MEDSSLVLKSIETDDDAVAPAGETAILRSVILGFYSGPIFLTGTLDSVTNPTMYTPPSSYVAPYDPTTDSGMVKDAAHVWENVSDGWLSFIRDNAHLWPGSHVEKTRECIHWMKIQGSRQGLNATRTAANRIKFFEEAASFPTGVNGEIRQLVDAMADGIALPTKDWCWVNPTDLTRTDITGALTLFSGATNVENAPGTAKLLGRDWINDIP